MVGAVGSQNLGAPGLEPSHPDSMFIGRGSAVGEEHPVQVPGGPLGDQPGQLTPHVVGEGGAHGAPAVGLPLDGLHQGGVLVTEVGVHQLRGKVQVVVALRVPEAAPACPYDQGRVEVALGGPWVQDVVAVVSQGPGHVHAVALGAHLVWGTARSTWLRPDSGHLPVATSVRA